MENTKSNIEVKASDTETRTWAQFRADNRKDGKSESTVSEDWKSLKDKGLLDTKKAVGAVGAVTSGQEDPHDKKLDFFQYAGDATSFEWERENIYNLDSLRKKYPELEFRIRAIDPGSKELRKGNDYMGWQIFKDKDNPNGIRKGGDGLVAAMPKERARAYNKYTQNKSTELIKDTQRAKAERGYGEEGGFATITDKKTGHSTEQFRGLHPDEMAELRAKGEEDRGRNRVYSRP